MAHGCNIGPDTMAQITPGISYWQLQRITDWQLTNETQRAALADVVNAIARLDITSGRGKEKTVHLRLHVAATLTPPNSPGFAEKEIISIHWREMWLLPSGEESPSETFMS